MFQSLFIVEWAVKLLKSYLDNFKINKFQSLFIVEWAVKKDLYPELIAYLSKFQSLFIVEWAVKIAILSISKFISLVSILIHCGMGGEDNRKGDS